MPLAVNIRACIFIKLQKLKSLNTLSLEQIKVHSSDSSPFHEIKSLNTLSLEQIKVHLQYNNTKTVGRNGMGRNCHGPMG